MSPVAEQSSAVVPSQ